MTKFSFEVPIAHLEEFEDLQDFHFSLSMLYENPVYEQFMHKQIDKGLKTVWLDNSYNEQLKATKHEDLARIMSVHDCSKVIAPDSPKWSTEQIFDSWDEMSQLVARWKVMIVVSNKEMFEKAKAMGIQPISISYWTRINMTWEELRWTKNCHFLGMLSVQELFDLRPPSCDTSMPIKMALKGLTIDEWEATGHPHYYTHEMPEFFDYIMSRKEIALARQNIIRLRELLTEGGNDEQSTDE